MRRFNGVATKYINNYMEVCYEEKYEILIVIIAVIGILWATLTFIDYFRGFHFFEKHYFAIQTIAADNGGYGKYVGLVY